MSDREKHGGPAFPITPENEVRMNGNGGRGMTLRDWFAGQAMAGEVATQSGEAGYLHTEEHYIKMAEKAYAMADAMLAEREVEF